MKSIPSFSQLQRRREANRRRASTSAQALDRPVNGTLMLRPNGDHWLQLEVNGISLLIHRGQMERLEALFAVARAEMEADGHRGDDRLYMSSVRLGVH